MERVGINSCKEDITNPLKYFNMELNFNKEGNEYVAEFEVTGDFNLHVEKDKAGRFDIYQRTTQNGEYTSIENLKYQYDKKVIDYDFIGYIYPKYIKVISKFEPIMAIVTFNE